MYRNACAAALTACLLGGLAAADTVVTFEDGAEGWSGPQGPGGGTVIETTGGNPDHNMHTVFNNFGIIFPNSTNANFVGDYTQFPTVTLSIDVRVLQVEFFGTPVSRPWLVELFDYDDPPVGYAGVSVWYKFADITSAAHGDWTTFEVMFDTSSIDLPPGWGGTGAEDPVTFEPMLPSDRTFQGVLAGIDEIVFTTYEPGFFYGFTDFELRLDNIAIATGGGAVPGEVPELTVDRGATDGEIVLSWSATCGVAEDYAIYEGTIGSWASHVIVACTDSGGDLTEEFTAGVGDRYYLVVPLDASNEGSYGLGNGTERLPAASACRATQNTNSCLP